jgi:hypothetical protein
MILTGVNQKLGIKDCPNVTFSTTNPTWIDPDANTGLRGERPVTNRLSYGTAQPQGELRLCVKMWPLEEK